MTKRTRLPLRKNPSFFSIASVKNSSYWRIYFLPNDLNQVRLAVIVPKAVSKLSTARNKIRRRITNLFWEELNFSARQKIELRKNIDLAIVVSWRMRDLSIEELKKQIEEIISHM